MKLIPCTKNCAKTIGPRGEPNTVILPNGYSNKLPPPKFYLPTHRLLHLPTPIREASFYNKGQWLQRPTTRQAAENKGLESVHLQWLAISHPLPTRFGDHIGRGEQKDYRNKSSWVSAADSICQTGQHCCTFELAAAVAACTRPAKDQPARIPAQTGEGLVKCHPSWRATGSWWLLGEGK